MRWPITLLLLLPLMAQAAGGAWSGSAGGPPLANRGSWMRSQPLTPPTGVGGEVSVISWRYELSRPAPSGLEVRLCGVQRCATLEGASGVTRGLAHLSADEPLHMVFGFAGSGALPPGLRVVSSEVMVNYE